MGAVVMTRNEDDKHIEDVVRHATQPEGHLDKDQTLQITPVCRRHIVDARLLAELKYFEVRGKGKSGVKLQA